MGQPKKRSEKTYDCGIFGKLGQAELLLLMKIVSVGTFIMESDDKPGEIEQLQTIEEKILEAVRASGAADKDWFVKAKQITKEEAKQLAEITGESAEKIVKDLSEKFADKYFLSDVKFEETLNDYVKPYNEDYFWNELAAKLAARDMRRDGIKEMPDDLMEGFDLIVEYEDKYRSEFDEYGIDRLEIDD